MVVVRGVGWGLEGGGVEKWGGCDVLCACTERRVWLYEPIYLFSIFELG